MLGEQGGGSAATDPPPRVESVGDGALVARLRGACTSRWSTPCCTATASSASRRSPRGRPERPWRSSCRGSARRRSPASEDGPLEALRRYVADRVRDRPASVPAGRRGRGADQPAATSSSARSCCSSATARRPRTRRVPAPRRRRLPDRGRASTRRAKRSSRTCAARSSKSCARATTSTPQTSCAAPRGWAATSRAASSRSAPSCPPTARGTSSRRSPGTTRARSRSTSTAAACHASTRCCRPTAATARPSDARARAGRWPTRLGAPRHRRALQLLRRPRRPRPRDPGGRARPRRPAALRRRPATGCRTSGPGPTGCCSASSPRTPRRCARFYEDTIAPVVRYDDQYRTDLVGTLEAYFEHNCNMNATAAAIYRPPAYGRLPAGSGEGAHRPRCDAVGGSRAARAGSEGVPDHLAAPPALTGSVADLARLRRPAFGGQCMRTAPPRRSASATPISRSGQWRTPRWPPGDGPLSSRAASGDVRSERATWTLAPTATGAAPEALPPRAGGAMAPPRSAYYSAP